MASLPPGTLLAGGRYQLVREINRGGTAVVYEGVDLSCGGQRVALKVLNMKEGKLAVPAKAVKREIELAAGLQGCPYVVQLLNFFAEGEQQAVIVWELVEGPDLLDHLNEHGGKMEEHVAAHYFAQLVQGVRYLHERGLCHRDLKPENCLVERSTGRLRIIDFGLSKRQASAVTLGVGTPDYIPPEMVRGGDINILSQRTTGSYDATKVDCWSMGVLLYLLVAGTYPFEDPVHPQDVVRTLRNIASGAYRPLPRHVSPACADLIARMLVVEPSARIGLEDIAAHPFLAAQEELDSQSEAGSEESEEDPMQPAPQPAQQSSGAEQTYCGMEMEHTGSASSAAAAGVAAASAGQGCAGSSCPVAALGVLQQLQQLQAGAFPMEVESAAAPAPAAASIAAPRSHVGRAATETDQFELELPATIAAFPAGHDRTTTFSFPHPADGVGADTKAAPATPRVSLSAAPKAPAQQGPPSRGSTEVGAAAKRQRASAAGLFCSFFGGLAVFGGGGACPRTSSCEQDEQA